MRELVQMRLWCPWRARGTLLSGRARLPFEGLRCVQDLNQGSHLGMQTVLALLVDAASQ